DGQIVEFRKSLPDGLKYDQIGESVGFFRFDANCAKRIALECTRFENEGLTDSPHEEALRNVLLERPESFAVEDVTGLPWIEIDFPEDVERARSEILSAIRAEVTDF
ncbi:MAG TPA: hypothetical protein VKN35_08435, partial [Xanthomonadales bacterium]|nr:hypothetical protein [Xanthomonadales bacterium]